MQGFPIWIVQIPLQNIPSTVQISLYFFFLSQSPILGTPDKIEGTVTASKKIITWNLFPTYIPLDIGKVNPTTGFNKLSTFYFKIEILTPKSIYCNAKI